MPRIELHYGREYCATTGAKCNFALQDFVSTTASNATRLNSFEKLPYKLMYTKQRGDTGILRQFGSLLFKKCAINVTLLFVCDAQNVSQKQRVISRNHVLIKAFILVNQLLISQKKVLIKTSIVVTRLS